MLCSLGHDNTFLLAGQDAELPDALLHGKWTLLFKMGKALLFKRSRSTGFPWRRKQGNHFVPLTGVQMLSPEPPTQHQTFHIRCGLTRLGSVGVRAHGHVVCVCVSCLLSIHPFGFPFSHGVCRRFQGVANCPGLPATVLGKPEWLALKVPGALRT